MAEEAAVLLQAAALDSIPHGFGTAMGGVSTGKVAGLQCGFGAEDHDSNVAENRRRVIAATLPSASLATPYQVHSAEAVIVEAPWSHENRPRADAVVTAVPQLLLGIVTADCAPVLLADAQAGVVAAAHAGWRGATGGILEATVAAMEQAGARPSRIVAAIGPCIAQASYEVDEAFRANFSAADDRFFAEGHGGHWQFDLPAFCAARLHAAGVTQVSDCAEDTYSQPDRFYSYRRATHLGEATYGRQISVIGLHQSA
ncbi:Laccase domain protein [Alteripontixanthobacter maritimus]|uniref:Purine nucleoside phosphorylase n=1 Tax=Alteripontixanthobacter maritimus TaxID=2161824 RepID=A0A369QCV3_9SPHN|nr:peptidoglycan editing factor PgeF [Alteripontixanthobacter maritimus]RDC61066.1 Laccase domain protein [Alteripontixanthobacter maritimus]